MLVRRYERIYGNPPETTGRLASRLSRSLKASELTEGVPRIILLGQDRRAEDLRRGWSSWGTGKKQLGGLGSAVSSPAGFMAEPRPPNVFPLFSALSMAFPNTIILLIMDYHAAVGGQGLVASLLSSGVRCGGSCARAMAGFSM